ncbi:MAG: ribosome maturation factor RimM [Halothiobacillus sp.]|jgi:16S rRNA processing protein RimM|uniref:ribosome maturation factor RimM n=1 Tax=Halothiobacillus sp. TaxID=1891311 RepID=UPI002AD48C5E|nr:ribosome maturation factor RimM [Halothiobacillus sp.]MDA3877508.1 ribosome maturation factor RimM [Halothiobacillus sp.]
MTSPIDPIVIGVIGRAFGIKGWVWVSSHTRPEDGIQRYKRWYVAPDATGASGQWIKVSTFAKQSNGIIAKLQGVDDRTHAEALTGKHVIVSAADLPKAAEGEYYWRDLVGCRVEHVSGQLFGEVQELIETGANDVLVVEGDRERLIPFIPDQVLVSIDLDKRLIVVDWDPDF